MGIDFLKFSAIAILLFTTPGFAFLSITRIWRDWPALQRWIAAIGISFAFYPILYYWARTLLPNLHLGVHKLWGLIILLSLLTGFYFWTERKTLFHLKPLEWVAVGVILLTLFTRFWIIADRPFPAWSDALHHVLITQLTAENGQLPFTLEPYAPTPLDMYHLGLYSLTGSIEILTGLPAHTSFLWISQLLNGLCGLGVYLLLDRKMNRRAALIGLLAIGLWSFQPAWYVNWSRTTSLAANTVLLIAALFTWETLESFTGEVPQRKAISIGLIVASGMLNAAMFLFHFRVAVYYLPLLLVICGWQIWSCRKKTQLKKCLTPILFIGLLALLLISPVLVKAIPSYFDMKSITGNVEVDTQYYPMPFSGVFQIGIPFWLLIIVCVSVSTALILRNKMVLVFLAWLGFLAVEAFGYLTKIPVLMFTNVSAVVVILYLPASILIGLGFGELFDLLERRDDKNSSHLLLVLCLISGMVCIPQRISGVEDYRFFVTDADVKAMDWIRTNTPSDAIFAINTYMWLGKVPHGTDAGYWIPYFTGRRTTASTMIYGLGSDVFAKQIQEMSNIVAKMEYDPSQITGLCDYDIDYIYSGAKKDQLKQGFTVDKLLTSPVSRLIYDSDGVYIFNICGGH